MTNNLSKIAFLDRDGTLIFEPADTRQIDSAEKVRVLPNVFAQLNILKTHGYRFVMVSNQDGLGGPAFSRTGFDASQKKLFDLLQDEGVELYRIFICSDAADDGCDCRKPKPGLLTEFLQSEKIDVKKSFMVGDRESDMEFARNIGVAGYKMQTNGRFPRIAGICRNSTETNMSALVNLDGVGNFSIDTGIGFFNHMLEQFSKHSLIDLALTARGDLFIDEHHTIEDTALVLGEALSAALGSRRGIRRYGFLLPMDDTLVECAIDLGGRPYAVFDASFKREMVGDLPTEMVEHFFCSLSVSLRANIHLAVRYSRNEHHKIEALFKAFAKAMRAACERDARLQDVLPSTKGIL